MSTPDINVILAEPHNRGCNQFGANMGRRSQIQGEPEKLHLQRLQMVDECYDTGGAYWGGPDKSGCMWCAFSDESSTNETPIQVFTRAKTRADAEKAVLEELTGEGWSFYPPPDDTVDSCDDFTRAYIIAGLWSSNDESTPSGGEPLDKNYTQDDLAPETVLKIKADCQKFQQDHKELLEKAYKLYHEKDYSPQEMAGHDFWLTRNHHGAGFWDRDLGEVGDKLTEAAHAFSEVNLYVGDDKKIYL